MNDNSVLSRKLAALSSTSTFAKDGSRAISNGIWPQPLLAILAEIDDTVLKRKLTFSTTDASISLIAAGRRLMAIVDVSDGMEFNKEFLSHPLEISDADAIAAACALLTAFAEKKVRIAVTSEAADAGGHTDAGISGTMLSEALELDTEEEQSEPMQHFIDAAQEQITTCLFFIADEEIGEIGEDADIEKIRALLKDDWPEFRAKIPALNTDTPEPFLICMADALGESISLFVAEAGKTLAAFSSSNEDAPAIHECWGNYFVI